ncbi:regulator of G-protein signaling 5-like [Polyodon spathula]|uniref:regulator of G-protein signaling 5-like n=1 Tax=Polyodon spathula TaxID=7913 RepID=UPI001B7DE5A9|nr:regulator of G-protein signaling 5-like [Polyodon spathula]
MKMCKALESLPNNCLERAKGLKARLSIFLQKSDASSNPGHSSKAYKLRPSLEEALEWRETFDKLLTNKHGLAAFRAFLKSEFSEENIEFWLACEDYKNTKSSAKLSSKAKNIYEEYFENDAPKEVNIDHETKKITKNNLLHPSLSCFDLAQNKIYTLMEKDSYSRFLKSSIYQELTKNPMCSCIQKQSSSQKSHT